MNAIIEQTGEPVPAPIAQPPRAASPFELVASAVERGASIEMVERLIALQEKVEANEARKAFVSAMAEFKANEITITKNKHVGFESRKTDSKTDYHHATLDNVCATVDPLLARVGLSYRWKTEQLDGGMIQVTCIVRHALGHAEETALRSGADQSGNKNNVQAVGSTVSYLSRYTLMAALGLASSDMDDDGRASDDQRITMDDVRLLQDGLAKAQADIPKFCQWLKVGALAEIKKADLGRAWETINAKRAKLDLERTGGEE